MPATVALAAIPADLVSFAAPSTVGIALRALMAARTTLQTQLAVVLGRLATLALTLAATGCRMVAQGRNVDGVRYFQQGQYPVAIQRFDAALTIDPNNPDSYYNKAAVYHRMGLTNRDQNTLTQAESLYNQCLNLNAN